MTSACLVQDRTKLTFKQATHMHPRGMILRKRVA
jgi:hypothetical protein